MDNYLNRLEHMDTLIRLRSTGPAQAFAERVGLSPSRLYDYLDLMRSRGGQIAYCRRSQTYYYADNKRFYLGYYEEEPGGGTA